MEKLRQLKALKNLLTKDVKVKLKEKGQNNSQPYISEWNMLKIIDKVEKNLPTLLKVVYLLLSNKDSINELKEIWGRITYSYQLEILTLRFNIPLQHPIFKTSIYTTSVSKTPQQLDKTINLMPQSKISFQNIQQELLKLKKTFSLQSLNHLILNYGIRNNLSLRHMIQMFSSQSQKEGYKEKTFANGDRIHKFNYEFTNNNDQKESVSLCYIFYNKPGLCEIYFGQYDEFYRPHNQGWLLKFVNGEFQFLYSGDYYQGFKHGYGEEYRDGKLYYKGQFAYGKYHGFGSYFDEYNVEWQGTFDDGRKHGSFKNTSNQYQTPSSYFYDNIQPQSKAEIGKGPQSGQISSDFEMDLNTYIFDTLNGKQWLSSTVIDYILKLLQKQVDYLYENNQIIAQKTQQTKINPRILIMSTRFASDLERCQPNQQDLQQFKKFHYLRYIKYDEGLISKYDRIIIPVNENGMHFYLFFLDISKIEKNIKVDIRYCDSIQRDKSETRDSLIQKLGIWLLFENVEEKQIYYQGEFKLTKQVDSYNCGIHLIYHTYLLSQGYNFEKQLMERTIKMFEKNKMTSFRKRLKKVLLRQELSLFDK